MKFPCGIDMGTQKSHICVIDKDDCRHLDKEVTTDPALIHKLLKPFPKVRKSKQRGAKAVGYGTVGHKLATASYCMLEIRARRTPYPGALTGQQSPFS